MTGWKWIGSLHGVVVAAALAGCAGGGGRSAAVDHPAAAPSGAAKPLSFSILEDYDRGESLAEAARDFALFRELGITTWRGSIGWDDYEPSDGRFELDWLHRFAALAADSGITLRPYLGYTAEWAAAGRTGDGQTWNDPPARLADWRDFVRRVARELSHHPNVRSYEIYNEENTKLWWDGTVEEYAATLAAAADELAASHPGAAVLMGGLVWPDADWLEATCGLHGNAERVDVIPLHAYAETWPDSVAIEDYLDPQFDDFIETAAASCGRNTVWINETGFATTPGRSEREQANWWARAVATFAAHPRVEHIGVYEIKDLRKDSPVIGDAPNYHLGLTRTDRTPKLAFRTVDLLTDLLDVGRLVVRDAELDVTVTAGRPGRLFHHLFQRPDGRLVLIVWDRSAAPVLRIGLPRTGRVTEYGLDGTATRFEAVDGRALTGVRLVPGEARIFEIRP